MRFTARPLGRGRRAISDICEGLPERDTPLDFTTREVVRETFHWRVWSLPLLVQITFRTLNLFREVGCRPLLRARVKVLRFLPSILFWYKAFSHSHQIYASDVSYCVTQGTNLIKINGRFSWIEVTENYVYLALNIILYFLSIPYFRYDLFWIILRMA